VSDTCEMDVREGWADPSIICGRPGEFRVADKGRLNPVRTRTACGECVQNFYPVPVQNPRWPGETWDPGWIVSPLEA
jgi:hypothetical protein